MSARINANSCKNALGAVFLLATAFFVCSTFISMRSVLADPIAPTNPAGTGVQSGRQSPRSTSRTSNRTISRSTVSRSKAGATVTPTRSTVSRASVSRAATSRAITPTRPNATVVSRGVSSRSQSSRGQSTRGTTNNRAVRARSGANVARVSATGNVMSGNSRASVGANQSYLNSRLYTGNYSNIIDSTTGLISAEAYSNCMDAYYTCMDEICTARNAAKGRCSCAGRAEKFLSSEEALQRANEELITLSGQLSLLISTKGKGEDLIAAFSLTDAEKVMNCVSWKDAVATAGSTTAVSTSDGTTKNISHDDYLKQWCKDHLLFDYQNNECLDGIKTTAGSEHGPSYCYESGNDFGFNLADLGSETSSTSDILAQLKSWADAKDLAKQYVNDDGTLLTQYTRLDNSVNALIYNSESTSTSSLDNLANKWGYKLFEYAHNNVCGRVLDSCFNGIYEACGTPITVIDSDEVTHSKCQNGATTSCPFNFNSYISVNSEGDVELNERSTTNTTAYTSASCFGYSSTKTTSTGTRSTSSSTDPYANLRGPVADARRSIMQKYLLDSNAACDVYGDALKTTAQNINYQKVAAQQALQQKRLEFKKEEDTSTRSNWETYATNFSTCLDEIWDCYYNADSDWTTARVKTYCAQKSNVPHCYETMICSPSNRGLQAVIDEADSKNCTFSQNFRKNTCRNITTISEILYGAGSTVMNASAYDALIYSDDDKAGINSYELREACLRQAGATTIREWKNADYIQCTSAELSSIPNAKKGYKETSLLHVCQHITECEVGYDIAEDGKSCIAHQCDANVYKTTTGDECATGYIKDDDSSCTSPEGIKYACKARTCSGITATVANGCPDGYNLDSSSDPCVGPSGLEYACTENTCGATYVAKTDSDCDLGYVRDMNKSCTNSEGTKYECKARTCSGQTAPSGGTCSDAGYDVDLTSVPCIESDVLRYQCVPHVCGDEYITSNPTTYDCGYGRYVDVDLASVCTTAGIDMYKCKNYEIELTYKCNSMGSVVVAKTQNVDMADLQSNVTKVHSVQSVCNTVADKSAWKCTDSNGTVIHLLGNAQMKQQRLFTEYGYHITSDETFVCEPEVAVTCNNNKFLCSTNGTYTELDGLIDTEATCPAWNNLNACPESEDCGYGVVYVPYNAGEVGYKNYDMLQNVLSNEVGLKYTDSSLVVTGVPLNKSTQDGLSVCKCPEATSFNVDGWRYKFKTNTDFIHLNFTNFNTIYNNNKNDYNINNTLRCNMLFDGCTKAFLYITADSNPVGVSDCVTHTFDIEDNTFNRRCVIQVSANDSGKCVCPNSIPLGGGDLSIKTIYDAYGEPICVPAE